MRRIVASGLCLALVAGAASLGAVAANQSQHTVARPLDQHIAPPLDGATLADAQRLFYNAQYAAAADLTLALRSSDTQDLANDELRSSALLFQLKALLETPGDKEGTRKDALKTCTTCPALLTAFFADIKHGQALARTRLQSDPADNDALFYLGKLDLNFVWLQLGPLRRKTGWDEYWEARRSLDTVLKRNPQHVRALVARAWIDYIVDTKMPWGTKWLLGGGNRKQALKAVLEAADIQTEFFTHAEAEFASWDMRVREHDMAEATTVARRLARDFPTNREVAEFLDAQDANHR